MLYLGRGRNVRGAFRVKVSPPAGRCSVRTKARGIFGGGAPLVCVYITQTRLLGKILLHRRCRLRARGLKGHFVVVVVVVVASSSACTTTICIHHCHTAAGVFNRDGKTRPSRIVLFPWGRTVYDFSKKGWLGVVSSSSSPPHHSGFDERTDPVRYTGRLCLSGLSTITDAPTQVPLTIPTCINNRYCV